MTVIDKSRPKAASVWRPIVWACTAIFVLWFISLNLLVSGGECDVGVLGPLGDSFGALNALFSGLAFAGVITALILQNREIDLQRRDLRATLDAQRESAEAARLQAEIRAAALRTESRAILQRSYVALLELHLNPRTIRLGEDLAQRLGDGFSPERILDSLTSLTLEAREYNEETVHPLSTRAVIKQSSD